jgi:hypothetical protein
MQMNQTDWHAAYGSLWEYQPHAADGSLCHEHDLSKKYYGIHEGSPCTASAMQRAKGFML